jgi:tRNA A-37 threonylcarbamoyl transferase component Bud32
LDLVGHVVGAYRILSLLGRGGTAEVYKAFHPALKREVALKVLLQEVSDDVDWVRRFRQEAELLGRLDHPHILPIYDAGEHEGRPFLVMKYMVDTTTLRSQLQGHPWPLNRVVKVISQVADALDAAHKAGVVHRDIKPSNILVTPDLRCSVFDFGIAKPFRRGDTTTGGDLIVGTPEFMSPEQCKGDRIDHRSDVYSLGVVTYQMLSGHVPFTAETAVGILMKHLTEPLPIPPRGVALPPAVNGVLRTAMARDARERFSTAGEFAEALSRSADQRATVTLHASGLRRVIVPTLKLPPWVRRMRTKEMRLSLAALTLAGTLGLVYALWPPPAQISRPNQTAVLRPPVTVEPEGTRESEEAVPAGAADPAPLASEGAVGASPAADKSLATLEIDSAEKGQVFLDGEFLGMAPGTFPSLAAGEHLVVLDAGEGRREEQTLVITAGSVHRIRFDFVKDATEPARISRRMTASASQAAEDTGDDADPPEIRRWTGYLTDEDCGATGGAQGSLHFRCAERCIRDGQKPMLYARGKLYRLDGFERIEISRDEPLRFKGWLEGGTIHVVAPGAESSLESDVKN